MKIIIGIFVVFFTLPAMAADANNTSLNVDASSIVGKPGMTVDAGNTSTGNPSAPTLNVDASSIVGNPGDLPSPTIQPRQIEQQPAKKNVGQQIGDVANKAWQGTKKGVTSAWNAVSGIFKSDPCSADAEKALKATDTNIEKTKLDTKQSGTDGEDGKAGKCVVSKCKKGWMPNENKTGCDQSEGDCTETAKGMHEKATEGELKKGKCYITECANGYHPSDDGASCEQAELSEKGSNDKIADLKDNAKKMKDKEQSTANKMLGAAAIGATGIGAMNLMEGLAEQKADSGAEEDMKAYLATFACDFGQGRNIKGGEANIDLPGGNDLMAAVTEYRALAADLKARKEALGKTPGIESEVIIDAAETGLYDNVGMGRQSGAYTSLSKALTDETSADAEAWAKQKADTASQVKTGAITAGIGAVGGLIGNLAINSGEKNKNKVDEINNRKYESLKQPLKELEESINSISETPTPCPADATGTPGNCKCTGNNIYNSNTGQCEACPDPKVPNEAGNACMLCPKGFMPASNGTCEQTPPDVVSECPDTSDPNMISDSQTGKCYCINGFQKSPTDSNACYCPERTYRVNSDTGQCEHVPDNRPIITITEDNLSSDMNSSNLFDTNKHNLKLEAYTEIGKFSAKFDLWTEQNPNTPYCVLIDGYTDKTGNDAINNPLSNKRAKAVYDALTDVPAENKRYAGHGSSACAKSGNQPDCRKVTITFQTSACAE